jgi:itaconyl-CoA hydratase
MIRFDSMSRPVEILPHSLSKGDEFETAGLTVTESHLVIWSGLTGDSVALHTDAEYAARSAFGQRIAHGPLTMSLAIGLSVQQRIFERNVLAWLGVDEVRAQRPVFCGDTIHAKLRIAELRSSSKPGRDVCVLGYSVCNQDDDEVMTFKNTLLLQAATAAAR